jgi:hypothetical protein
MIYFFADNHYDAHPGAAIHDELKPSLEMSFFEDDLSALSSPNFANECELLILNLIGGTCGTQLANAEAEKSVRAYLENGRPLLLLHGASAAFWHWDWWRELVGFRWVRSNDPDGVAASSHPTRPYRLEVAKSRHPLCKLLQPIDIPEDEIYINLEQTCPVTILMSTTTEEGTFPQCHENQTPWGGKVIGFLPGHRPTVTRHPDVLRNVKALIEYFQSNK